MAEAEPLAPIVVDGHKLSSISCAVNRWVMEKLPTCEANPFHILVHGQAGSGKSLLLKYIADGVRSHFGSTDSCIVTAPVAIAANLIGGRTIHSTFVLEWGQVDAKEFMNDATNLKNVTWGKGSKVLLIDNINFVGAVDFARIDHRLQQVTGVNKPFGGLSVIVFGDFHQVKPVSSSNQTGAKWIFEVPNKFISYLPAAYQAEARKKTPQSPEKLWSLFEIVELESQNWRNKEEQEYFDFMRCGEKEEKLRKYLNASCFACLDVNQTQDKLVDVYVQKINNRPAGCYAFLCVKDEIASDLNNAIVRKLGNERTFEPKESLGNTHAKNWKPESKNLMVAIGSPVVLLDNCQHINAGAIGHVEDITGHEITVRFPSGRLVPIQRLEYQSGRYSNAMRFKQFPLSLAYAYTIEKAQGATFDGIILVRNNNWNSKDISIWGNEFHGKLYTAISRCRKIQNCGITPMEFLQWVCAQEVTDELERMKRDNSLDI
ncbi:hypothetical protein B9Z55_026360 [Caenorhabditis nigoni]|uniref:ATP-dependent DNA helicase n=1 Tax=Caenorhabditis nigoni TaxID=1611254 RepID=A0A2G5T390_9PELO|nr:hypothetical protein B9Z55_026360 [Caenorhabditis nigoni]